MLENIEQAVRRHANNNGRVIESEPANAAEDRLYEPIFRAASDITVRGVEWLWPKRFPLAMLSLLVGNPNRGKSFLTVDMASRVTSGRPWPDCTDPQPAGDVVFIGCEDVPEVTVVPRLLAAGADLSRFYFLESARTFAEDGRPSEAAFDLSGTLPALDMMLQRLPNPKLVVVDPISGFLGRVDSNSNAEVRGALNPLVEVIQEHSVAMIGINHIRKSGGTHSSERQLGSIAFGAAARAVWEVHLDDASQGAALVCGKLNIAEPAKGLAFRICDSGQFDPAGEPIGRIEWHGDVEGNADDYARLATEGSGGMSSELEAVVLDFLKDGPKPVKDLNREAASIGASSKDVWRVRQRLCDPPTREGFGRGGAWLVSLKAP